MCGPGESLTHSHKTLFPFPQLSHSLTHSHCTQHIAFHYFTKPLSITNVKFSKKTNLQHRLRQFGLRHLQEAQASPSHIPPQTSPQEAHLPSPNPSLVARQRRHYYHRHHQYHHHHHLLSVPCRLFRAVLRLRQERAGVRPRGERGRGGGKRLRRPLPRLPALHAPDDTPKRDLLQRRSQRTSQLLPPAQFTGPPRRHRQSLHRDLERRFLRQLRRHRIPPQP